MMLHIAFRTVAAIPLSFQPSMESLLHSVATLEYFTGLSLSIDTVFV